MIIPNDQWTLVVALPTLLEMQNVGYTRIAYAYGTALPQSDDPEGEDPYIALDSDEHFMLAPGSAPYYYSGSALAVNVYARSLGAKEGLLSVRSTP